MPYSGDPTIGRDAIRLLVGDLSTSADSEFLADADYDYFLSVTPNRWIAAQLAANSLAAKFTGAAASADGDGYVEKSVGDLKIKKADAVQAAREYRTLSSLFARRAASGISPYAGGQTVSGMAEFDTDTDRVRPAFVSKLFDNSAATDFNGSGST